MRPVGAEVGARSERLYVEVFCSNLARLAPPDKSAAVNAVRLMMQHPHEHRPQALTTAKARGEGYFAVKASLRLRMILTREVGGWCIDGFVDRADKRWYDNEA